MTERILILGLAREGLSLGRHFADRAHVTVTDSAVESTLGNGVADLRALGVRVVAGENSPDLVSETDRFFVSPGIPENNPVYVAARARGLRVESMTTLFFDLCPSPIIGVTGSSGKTTTTSLIGHILRTTGLDVQVGGNIGDPMLDLLPHLRPTSRAVVELSSFQLDLLRKSPQAAVVTNLTPNHLDRHGTMDAYIAAKRHIVDHQVAGDRAVLNADDETVSSFSGATPADISFFSRRRPVHRGAYVRHGQIVTVGESENTVMPVDDVPLLGDHNVENVLAALATTTPLGVDTATQREAIATFHPAPHRLQIVGVRNGVSYIDDSIATSPARAIVALQALSQPVLLIAGGRDKDLPWDEFARVAVQRVRALYLIGEAAPLIQSAMDREMGGYDGTLDRSHIYRCGSLQEAVERAGAAARPGEVVLLSPGCTSYDMFHNFEERGAAFARAVGSVYAA